MENEKLKSLVVKIHDEFNDGSVQNLWDSFQAYTKNHRQFFEKLTPYQYLKLFFYLYSYLKTQDFKFGNQIMENFFISYLLERTDENYQETCDRCSGDGQLECDNCDGTGDVGCEECDRTGKLTCSVCDGEKEIEGSDGTMEDCDNCDGSGEEDCYECDGDGVVSCRDCGGNGRDECTDCYGEGELEDEDKFKIELLLVGSWNKDFRNRCELTQNTLEVTISEENFEDYPGMFVLNTEETFEEIDQDLETEELYCVYYSDNPELSFNRNFLFSLKRRPNIGNYLV